MKTSARNQLAGTIREVIKGPVSAEVTIEIVGGVRITSIISAKSVDDLGLAPGKRAYALVKASNVIVAVD
jgi:molybdopterin-binding protein